VSLDLLLSHLILVVLANKNLKAVKISKTFKNIINLLLFQNYSFLQMI
jgi:hypothetical protein